MIRGTARATGRHGTTIRGIGHLDGDVIARITDGMTHSGDRRIHITVGDMDGVIRTIIHTIHIIHIIRADIITILMADADRSVHLTARADADRN